MSDFWQDKASDFSSATYHALCLLAGEPHPAWHLEWLDYHLGRATQGLHQHQEYVHDIHTLFDKIKLTDEEATE